MSLFWHHLVFPSGTSGKEPACQCRRHKKCGFNCWVRKLPWTKKMATPSRILAWRIPVDRGAWRATVHGVTKSQTYLKQLSTLNDDLPSSKQTNVLKKGLITERIKNCLEVENAWSAFHYDQCSSKWNLLRAGSQVGRGVTAIDGAANNGSIIHVKLGNFCTVSYNGSAEGSCANRRRAPLPVSTESALVSVVPLGPPPFIGTLGVAQFLQGSEHQHHLELSCSLKDHGGPPGVKVAEPTLGGQEAGAREGRAWKGTVLPPMSPLAVTSAGVFAS